MSDTKLNCTSPACEAHEVADDISAVTDRLMQEVFGDSSISFPGAASSLHLSKLAAMSVGLPKSDITYKSAIGMAVLGFVAGHVLEIQLAHGLDTLSDSQELLGKFRETLRVWGMWTPSTERVYHAVFFQMTRDALDTPPRRIELTECHPLFQRTYKTIWPNAEAIDKRKRHGACDFLLQVDTELVPVEIKAGPFDRAAFGQLLSYMNVYGAKSGIAVGSEQKVLLPETVTFVSFGDLRDVEQGKGKSTCIARDKISA